MGRTFQSRLRDRRPGDSLPDGVGGSVTGGPMRAPDLMEILSKGTRAATRAGAVSGAAQSIDSRSGSRFDEAKAIALSDGSRISFASLADQRLVTDDADL